MITDDRALEAAWKSCSSWDGKITKPVLRKAIAAYLREIDVEPVAWTTQSQLDGIKGTGNNAVMWGEPLPYHPDIPLYTSPTAALKELGKGDGR